MKPHLKASEHIAHELEIHFQTMLEEQEAQRQEEQELRDLESYQDWYEDIYNWYYPNRMGAFEFEEDYYND
jgi:DNA-binding transcriptional regulator GbsR (MarR family)